MLKDFQSWPVPGGWIKQTEKFLNAVDLCDKVRNVYRHREKQKSDEANAMREEIQKVMRNASNNR